MLVFIVFWFILYFMNNDFVFFEIEKNFSIVLRFVCFSLSIVKKNLMWMLYLKFFGD